MSRPSIPRTTLHRSRGLALAGFALLLALGASADTPPAPAPQDFSLAEVRLFMSDHLKSLPPHPQVLAYHFVKAGSFESGYEDKVTLDVSPPNPKEDNGRDIKLEFLTGSHKLELPTIEGAKGNPVIMGFLERDVREMTRITGGGGTQGSYYKKRLRMAMVDTKESKPVTVKWSGHDVKAEEITIDPYKDDPVRTRYARFANKTYSFVLSDQVPGGVVSIRSVMRDSANPQKIMIEESLTLTENK